MPKYIVHRVDVAEDGVTVALTDVTDSVIVSESVVRCKDCTHYHAFKHYAYCTVINVKGKHPQPNDYCSYAEEKTFP